MKYFFERRLELNPEVIISIPGKNDSTNYKAKTLIGQYYRVKPIRWHEIQYVAALEKGQQVYAPLRGEGVILTKQATPQI